MTYKTYIISHDICQDLPTYLPAASAAAPLPPAPALLEMASLAKRKASRSDSYSQAMDAEEGQYQVTAGCEDDLQL